MGLVLNPITITCVMAIAYQLIIPLKMPMFWNFTKN